MPRTSRSFIRRAPAPVVAGLLVAAGPLGCVSAGGSGSLQRPYASTSYVADTMAWQGRPVAHVEDLLAGYLPGIQVTSGAGGSMIRVRGAASLRGANESTEPLIIVDGLPLMPRGRGTLAGLNPADVARIEVLTDAADLTFYGVRGGNGVIRITTKRSRGR